MVSANAGDEDLAFVQQDWRRDAGRTHDRCQQPELRIEQPNFDIFFRFAEFGFFQLAMDFARVQLVKNACGEILRRRGNPHKREWASQGNPVAQLKSGAVNAQFLTYMNQDLVLSDWP